MAFGAVTTDAGAWAALLSGSSDAKTNVWVAGSFTGTVRVPAWTSFLPFGRDGQDFDPDWGSRTDKTLRDLVC